MVEGRKMIQNYFQTISELRQLKVHRLVFTRVSGACFAAFGSYFCPLRLNYFFPDREFEL